MFLQIAVIQLQKKLNQNRKNKIENWGLFYFFNRRLPLNLTCTRAGAVKHRINCGQPNQQPMNR